MVEDPSGRGRENEERDDTAHDRALTVGADVNGPARAAVGLAMGLAVVVGLAVTGFVGEVVTGGLARGEAVDAGAAAGYGIALILLSAVLVAASAVSRASRSRVFGYVVIGASVVGIAISLAVGLLGVGFWAAAQPAGAPPPSALLQFVVVAGVAAPSVVGAAVGFLMLRLARVP